MRAGALRAEADTSQEPVNSPFFSVIIPLYNKEPYITRALDSVSKQKYTDYEIIVVDDVSTDNGLCVAESHLKVSEHRYTIVRRQQRGGSCAPARATGCRYARGKYFAFLDADDEWNERFLAEIHSLIETFPEAEAYATNRELVIDGKVKKGPYQPRVGDSKPHIIDLEAFLDSRRESGNPFRVQGMAFRPEALDDIGGFVHAPRSSDIDLMFRFFLRGKRAAWSPYCGLRIHRVPDSTMAHTELQFTRPWFYSVVEAIDRGVLPRRIVRKLREDIWRQKHADLCKAASLRRLSLSYWSTISLPPVRFTSLFLVIITVLPVLQSSVGCYQRIVRLSSVLGKKLKHILRQRKTPRVASTRNTDQ